MSDIVLSKTQIYMHAHEKKNTNSNFHHEKKFVNWAREKLLTITGMFLVSLLWPPLTSVLASMEEEAAELVAAVVVFLLDKT